MSADPTDDKLRALMHEIRAEDAAEAPAFAVSWGRALEAHAAKQHASWWRSGWMPLATALASVAIVAIAVALWSGGRNGTSELLGEGDDLVGWISPSDDLLGLGEPISLELGESAEGLSELALELPTDGLINEAFSAFDAELEL